MLIRCLISAVVVCFISGASHAAAKIDKFSKSVFQPEPNSVIPSDARPAPPTFEGKALIRDSSGNYVPITPMSSESTAETKRPNAPQIPGPDIFVLDGSEASVAVNYDNSNNLIAAYNEGCPGGTPHSNSIDGNLTWTARIFPPGAGAFTGTPFDPWAVAGNTAGEFFSTFIRRNVPFTGLSHCIISHSMDGGATFPLFFEVNKATFQDREMVDIDRTAVRGGSAGAFDGFVYLCYDDWTPGPTSYQASFFQAINPAGFGFVPTQISGLGTVPFRGTQFQPVAGIADGQIYLQSTGISGNGATIIAYFHEINGAGGGPNKFCKSILSWPAAGQNLAGTARYGLNGHRIDNHGYLDIDRSSGPRRGNLYFISNRNPNPNNPNLDQGDIYLSVSTDGASTWSTTVIPTAPGKTQYFPMMAVDRWGYIHVAYYQNETGLVNNGVLNASSANIYYTCSIDGGISWMTPLQVNALAHPLNFPDPPPNRFAQQYYLVGDYQQLRAMHVPPLAPTDYVMWTGYDMTNPNLCPGFMEAQIFCTTIDFPLIRAGLTPGQSLNPIHLQPRGGVTNIGMSLAAGFSSIGFFLDSVKIAGALNDGFLVTTQDAIGGTFIPGGGAYTFTLTFNTNAVSPANQGLRSGFIEAYLHSNGPPVAATVRLPITVYVVPNLTFNRTLTLHSGTNFTDIGTQGSIANQSGRGLFYPADPAAAPSNRFYDGGVLIANSALNTPLTILGAPRKVTRQLFGDQFLRCLADGILDSIPGNGGAYYNLFLKSVATDLEDSSLVWQNIWEQCTHSDSSDFLLQTLRLINVSNSPIDSVAFGVLYDIDVTSPISFAGENVGRDTIFLASDGRYYRFGWIAGNNAAVDPCAENSQMYGYLVIPGSTGAVGDTIGARGSVIFWQQAFSYRIDNNDPAGGDPLAQQYAWNISGYHSTANPADNFLTGVNSRCVTGLAESNDMGYLAIAKKVYNFPVNGGGAGMVARYGLTGLAAGIDTTFSGPGEQFTVIHVGSSAGLAGLIANANVAVNWYNNHVNLQVGPAQTRLKGDLNNDEILSPADVVLELNDVFLGQDATPWPPSPSSKVIPVCVADLNDNGGLSPADLVQLLNGIFIGNGCANCLKPCI